MPQRELVIVLACAYNLMTNDIRSEGTKSQLNYSCQQVIILVQSQLFLPGSGYERGR